MLKIITGAAGTGKSALLHKMINKTAESGKKAVLFVPDQFSFEAEKIIYRTLPHSLLDNVRVTMFSREAEKLLRLFGESKEYADNIAKKILMTRAVKEVAREGSLLYYGRQAGKPEFSDFALSVVSEMRGAGISSAELRKKASEEQEFTETLTKKINDICAFYSRYDELLTVNFSDRLDDVRRASEMVLINEFYNDTVCFFDCFDSFSGNQMSFISALMKKSEGCVFALTCDTERQNDRRFFAASRLMGKLKAEADGDCEEIRLTECFRRPFERRVIKARDVWQECDWICAEIRRITDSGARYRDIAVLSPADDYSQVLKSAMKKYDIPAFIDIPEPLISRSFVKFPIYTLKALSFETEDILRYLKSGYVRIDGHTVRNTDIDALERLCRRYDLRRRDWLRRFPEKIKDAGRLEELRRNIIEPLSALREELIGKDGAEMTRALCGFIFDTMNMNRTIYGKCILGHGDAKDGEKAKNIIDRRRLDEYSSLLDDAITVFESLYKSLAGYYPTEEEYLGILTDIFTVTTTAKPPQVLDAVTVGDTERSRFSSVKAVFICGFSNGLIPRQKSFSAAFTGSEGDCLAKNGIPIGGDRRTRFSEEAFSVYRCVNLPEERLYMTYSALNTSFGACEPSPYLGDIKNEHGIEEEGADSFGADFYCRTEAAAARCYAAAYPDPTKAAERNALAERLPDSYKNMISGSAESEEPESARRLITREHGKSLLLADSYSPTALEKLGSCRFNFFCSYGLGARAPMDRRIDPALAGNVVHYCLCRLLREYADKPDSFKALTPREIYRHAVRSIERYELETYSEGFGGTNRFSYLLKRLAGTAARAALRIQSEIAGGTFYPELLERELSFKFGDVTIRGKCDRIDSAVENGKKYIRVIDYKHGDKKIALKDAFSGRELQMLLYLFGACKTLDAAPASVMYSLIGSPKNLSGDTPDRGKAEADSARAYIKDHSMRGLLLLDSPEAEEIDRLNLDLSEKYGKLSKGLPYIKTERINYEQFTLLESYCRSYVNAIITEAVNGMIGSNCTDKKFCGWCSYTTICGKNIEEEQENERFEL